eukprot:6195877-Pyramimonas_sp.AAC.1
MPLLRGPLQGRLLSRMPKRIQPRRRGLSRTSSGTGACSSEDPRPCPQAAELRGGAWSDPSPRSACNRCPRSRIPGGSRLSFRCLRERRRWPRAG